MSDVARHGRTIVFVSHNMTALRKLCPRAIRLDGGQIVEDGNSDDVVSHYLQTNMDSSSSPSGAILKLRRAIIAFAFAACA